MIPGRASDWQSGIAVILSLMARSFTRSFLFATVYVASGCLTGQWPLEHTVASSAPAAGFIPSELIKINLCARAVCNRKENWHRGAHHWRERVKSLNEWGVRLSRGDWNINRNNDVTVGLGLFMCIRTNLGPLDLWKIFCTLRPLFWDFTSSPSWNTQDVLLQVFPKRKKTNTRHSSGRPQWSSCSGVALEY